jgi:photosystem II stability/assembly factor-like uncharacterized protein
VRVLAAVCFALLSWAATPAASGSAAGLPARAAVPAAARALLLDCAWAGSALVAVGERGAVVVSTDLGRTWTRSQTPTHETLTGVAFADAVEGWAVGHGGVILATLDGGANWVRQAEDESTSTSFLHVLALDARRAIAIGAFGTLRRTEDGGRTWASLPVPEGEPHLNRIFRDRRGRLWVAGEAGAVFVAKDPGAEFVREELPYEGSFFGVIEAADGTLVVHGLRGKAFRGDAGGPWEEMSAAAPVMLATAARLSDGTLVFAGAARWIFAAPPGGPSRRLPSHLTTAVAELVPLPDGAVLALGEAGASLLPATLFHPPAGP